MRRGRYGLQVPLACGATLEISAAGRSYCGQAFRQDEKPVDVNARIEEQLKSHDVLLYMKGTPDFPQCGFSGQTVAALNAIGKPYAFVNIFEDPEIREGLKTYSNWPTFPQLYVKGELIGGCDIVVDMYNSGELKKLLEESVAAE
ncbi:MAG: Grx4 family monothiol glutaredoxin [Woeseiaceae bacterium]|nr:Grx4 family monothiol glutaredoxin [Woeseiaceae bacterium]